YASGKSFGSAKCPSTTSTSPLSLLRKYFCARKAWLVASGSRKIITRGILYLDRTSAKRLPADVPRSAAVRTSCHRSVSRMADIGSSTSTTGVPYVIYTGQYECVLLVSSDR